MDLQEIGWAGGGGVDLIEVTERQVAGCCDSGNEPSGSNTCGNVLD